MYIYFKAVNISQTNLFNPYIVPEQILLLECLVVGKIV